MWEQTGRWLILTYRQGAKGLVYKCAEKDFLFRKNSWRAFVDLHQQAFIHRNYSEAQKER